MTQAEFDEYLLLLRQMLRITSRRRREIATEIRDHLEERFEDLCGEGVSQKEAIQLAIEEFGDAATLAAHFITITRNREKRWMMKVTAMSIGAVLITLMAAAAFWPADRRGVAPQNAAAQQARNEPASEAAGEAASQRGKQSGRQSGNQSTRGRAAGLGGFGSSGFGGMGGGKGVAPEGSRTPAAEKRLASRIDVEFLDTPLPEVLEFIEAKVGIQFYVKRDRIAETAENADNPVTIRLKQVRADMALELALAQAGGNALTYLLRDGIAIITTKEDVEATTEVRIYNCRDLLDPKQRRRGLTIRPPMPPGGEGMEGGGMGEGGMAAGAPGEMGGGGMGGMGGGMGGMGGMGGGMMGGGMMGGGMGGGMMGSGGGSSFGNARIRSADLIAIVQSMVGRPEDWRAEGGGAGMMAAYDGLVVVKTNTKNHAHIEKVLGMLREANSKQPGTTIRER